MNIYKYILFYELIYSHYIVTNITNISILLHIHYILISNKTNIFYIDGVY
jgi:hypothetical protein